MKKLTYFFIFIFFISILPLNLIANSSFINPFIDSLNPKQNAISVSRSSVIVVYFSQSMNSSTIISNNIRVYGMQTGLLNCNIIYNSVTKAATITPPGNFKPGEIINISLSSAIKTISNVSITPFVYNFTSSSGVGPGTFFQLSSVNAGSSPESVATGDFNGNNSIDLSTSNLGSANASILMNNGSGIFSNTQTLSTGSAPRLVVSGDFDMDGDLDLAVINNTNNSLNILANNGAGIFSNIATITNNGGPFSITTGDFDGDGDLDLAVVNYGSNTLFIYKNNGSGGFSYPDSYIVGTGPVCVTSGDINNDGNIDLVVAEWNINRISVLLNNGNASFTLSSTHNVGTNPHSVVLADIDGDKDLDILVGNTGSTYFSVLKNNGSGTFTPFSTITVGTGTVSLATGDIDGDGDLDLAVSNNQNGVSFYFNNGNGSFTYGSSTGITTGPRRIAFADFDGDGILDLAVPNTDLNNVLIFKNGNTPPQAPILVSPANGATGISLTPTFIWYAISNASSYKIEISLLSNFTTVIDSARVTTNQYTIASGKLNNSATYYWRVNAVNPYGTGQWSSVWSFSTITIPPAPVLISPANNSIGVSITPTLYWGALTGVTNYKVQISLNSSFTTLVDSSIVTNNFYLVPSGKLQNFTQYFWRVNASNSNGTGPWSVVWNFTTLVTGIDLISSIVPGEYKLYNNYPNPFNPVTKIKFDLPDNTIVSILVYDNIGRQISSLLNSKLMPGTYEVVWKGDNLSSGVYYYKILTDKYTAVKRMILLR